MDRKSDDGLTRWQRYRLKNIDAYRKRKREYAKTPEERKKRTEYMRAWRQKNRARHNELARQTYHRNKHKYVGKQREWNLRRKYGMSSHDFERLKSEQDNKCAICSTDSPARNRFHVDHDHFTGVVRGLLCSRCNGALGWYEKYAQPIVQYLKRRK